MKILQLRATAFITKNIGYTHDIAEEFRRILDLDGQVKGIIMPGVPINAFDQNEPQWGMPWSLVKQKGNDTVYNINFLPGKIDIIVNREAEYDSEVECEFLEKCSKWLIDICNKVDAVTSRLAYAPLYVIQNEIESELKVKWRKIVVLGSFEGSPVQDLNLSFNYKSEFELGDKTVQLNLLHNIFDGTQTIQNKNLIKTSRVIMIQLDLNTIPSEDYRFSESEVRLFFKNITSVKTQIVKELQV